MELSMCVGSYGFTDGIASDHRLPDGTVLRRVTVEPIIGAYRRMIRDLEFDICEVAPVTYMIARSCGVPLVALPIFLSRGFHYGDLVCRRDAAIQQPQDLHGKRVGVRAYTVTTGVWIRGMLSERYGVDVDRVEWVTDDEDHINALPLPPNVTKLPNGGSIAECFEQGSIHAAVKGAAGVGRKGSPMHEWNQTDVAVDAAFGYDHLFDDADRLAAQDYSETGIYPMHRAIVVRQDVLQRVPDIAELLFDLFDTAKRSYLSRLHDGSATSREDDEQRALSAIVQGDPLPHGFAVNRTSIEALIRYATEQHLLPPEGARSDELFLPIDS